MFALDWDDTIATVDTQSFCHPWNVVITRKNAKKSIYWPTSCRSRQLHGFTTHFCTPMHYDPSTNFHCYLIMFDTTSRKPQLVGLNDCTSDSVIISVNELKAPYNHPLIVEHISMRKIKTDPGSQFTPCNFREAWTNANIELSIAPPNHQ
jgi:hypothetical protein